MSESLQWAKFAVSTVLSWPVVVLVALLLFRRPLYMLFAATAEFRVSKLRVGGFTIELNELRREGKEAVDRFNRLSLLSAETRILEWEIARLMAGGRIPRDKDDEMEALLNLMRKLVKQDEGDILADPKTHHVSTHRRKSRSDENQG